MSRRRVTLAVLTLLALPGCWRLSGRHWDEARQTDIDPLNSALHRQLPRALAHKDLDAVLTFYTADTGSGVPWNEPVDISGSFTEQRLRWQGPAAEEPVRARYQHLLDQFASIERAELRIHRVYWDQHGSAGYPAEVRLLVRGIGPDGTQRFFDQHARLTLERRDGQWRITGEEITAREMLSSRAPAFQIATEAAGLGDVHDIDGSPPFRLIGDIGTSSGVAVADIDCDGYEDVALLSSAHLRLYRNAADGSFGDVSARMGVPERFDLAGSGLVFFDADNDGDPDLWLVGIKGQQFWRNEGCTHFVDATTAAGIPAREWSSMPVIADYDCDGWLDVYVVRMGDHQHTAPAPNWDARNGVGDSLYRNNGDGTFSDVTELAGIAGNGWGLAAAWGDYDGDGWPDLYVGNEFGTNDLYRNQGDGSFAEVAAAAGVLDRGAAMGVAWGDVDNDADLDLFVNNMYANSRWALFHPAFPPPLPWYLWWVPRADVDAITDEVTRGSTLLRNNGDGTFTDVSDGAGVRDAQWGWGAAFLDYDNDGRLDIYATNGFVTGQLPDDV